MRRAYLSLTARQVFSTSDSELYGELARSLPFAVEPAQRSAWEFQIQHLRLLAQHLPLAHFFVEFLIPRMGRRADLVLLCGGVIFVIEYKVGAKSFEKSACDQVYGYGLDLKNFHQPSHTPPVVPILVATEAPPASTRPLAWTDGLAAPLSAAPSQLAAIIQNIATSFPAPVDPLAWFAGGYCPTPTIVEAAQALYRGHHVEEIMRHESGEHNLTTTSRYVTQTIDDAKRHQKKVICFISGVPGSGKTLAGLNFATDRQRSHHDEHAVFLSGNGPLVEVLREALALDALATAKSKGLKASKVTEDKRASAFIQNIHHFRDEALASAAVPNEKVVVFDEAQRAWNLEQTSKFMREKRGQVGFSMSEPEFLLSVMDRHPDWCTILCLVGSGQEINTGESGIAEWLRALHRSFPHWHVHLSTVLQHDLLPTNTIAAPALHLATSIRSFRAEKLSDFVAHLIRGDAQSASHLQRELSAYPLFITRDLNHARAWLRHKRRATERMGLLTSSNATRLKPHGIFVKAKIEPANWFLAPLGDVRSSDALEDAATEFDVQGLEIDWACLCWDANFRWNGNTWEYHRFRGSRWEVIADSERQAYLANSYRVLLTRARQGLIVFIPQGDPYDHTRLSLWYDQTFHFLRHSGFQLLPDSPSR